MSLSERLYIDFPGDNVFVYPAGDEICPIAIGRIAREGRRIPFPLGYVTKVKSIDKEVGRGSGYWIIVKIIQVVFSKERQGWADKMNVILRRKYRKGLIKATMITAEVFVPNLFKL